MNNKTETEIENSELRIANDILENKILKLKSELSQQKELVESKDIAYKTLTEQCDLYFKKWQTEKELVEESRRELDAMTKELDDFRLGCISDVRKITELEQEIEGLKKEYEILKVKSDWQRESIDSQSLRIKELEGALKECCLRLISQVTYSKEDEPEKLYFFNAEDKAFLDTIKSLLSTPTSEPKEEKQWVCNSCNTPNFTQSVSQQEIDNEIISCISCGGFEFHLK